jgi:maltooligosyltrehalose trehalohydrolase
MGMTLRMLGAVPQPDGAIRFSVWAPNAMRVSVLGVDLEPDEDGFFSGLAEGGPGTDYRFTLDGARDWPDPCSRYQPDGVLGPSRTVDTGAFEIRPGPVLDEFVIYELHVGTFSDAGTFDGVVPRLKALVEAGVTAIELMPVATFPGRRGWGYDGLYTFAPHPCYGGPEGLARLIDAAHATGLAVILDVVYNHVGPGSEALSAFGPYFVPDSDTLWGQAIDYRLPGVREWAIQNAELWIRDYRMDGLRLDAVHAIADESSPVHVCAELKQRLGGALVISETAIGDRRPVEEWGHDAQWDDSLHHALHALLTGERDGYYREFGTVDDVVRALEATCPRLVSCAQNHDQVGNRAVGDRLPQAQHRLALATVLFARSTPLVFMGEEYDESHPFQFFTDHVDPAIAEATRKGRKEEFAQFDAFASDVPDPQAEETFLASRLAPRPPSQWFRDAVRRRRSLPEALEVERLDRQRICIRRGHHSLTVDFGSLTAEFAP